ncbi:FAD-binding oxidoreductase [Kineosporia sp. J2-2]|uniref:FAD-binding oxidoreductase n=1 Tax=Kineosporia corallincola TaxID=2835133 RepID=A0ABS5TEE3_9ACTN|nr:FAD-binding oxidoreductase [Kineosporia corallincola]MBT0769452.1 FAD-binding oxidoreductase [Kineosporia corallincola]
MSSTDVAIIGAGVIGTTLAAALVRRGRTVTLIEADRPGAGTSSNSYGWVNSHHKHPLEYHELNVQGVGAWRRLAEERPGVVAFTGHLEIAESQEHRRTLTGRTERLIGLGYPARWITAARARELTPVKMVDDALVALFEGEGHAFPARLIDELTREVGPVRRGTATAVEMQEDGVTVLLADGGEVDADVVVVCAGTGTEQLIASAGGALPLVPPRVDSPSFGYLADVRVPDHGVTALVTTDVLNLRPNGNGLLLVQALDLDGTAEPGVPAPAAVVREFGRRVAALLPGTSPRVVDVRVGHRVIPADGLSAAGPMAPGSRVWAVATHSGVTLAPWLAGVIAGELCGDEPDPRLAAFRPERFLMSSGNPDQAAPRVPGEQ